MPIPTTGYGKVDWSQHHIRVNNGAMVLNLTFNVCHFLQAKKYDVSMSQMF